jgi:hypothetical protein
MPTVVCRILLTVVSCTTPTTPPPTPAEAVAIFSASATPFQYVPEPEWPVRTPGPTVNVIPYDPDWPIPRASTFGIDAASMRAGEFLAAYATMRRAVPVLYPGVYPRFARRPAPRRTSDS